MSLDCSPSPSRHSLPRIDWENPKVNEIVDLVRRGEVSTRAAAKKLSGLLQRKVSHTTMQRRANISSDEKRFSKKPESPLREQSDDSVRLFEPVLGLSMSNSSNERMDPFVDKQWLEENNGCESYRITSSPAGGPSILEVWISQNLLRRYRASGCRDNVTHYRCATCDALNFDATQAGRTISVKDGRVPRTMLLDYDMEMRRMLAKGSDHSPHYSVSPDINEQGSSNPKVRRARTAIDWDSEEVRAILIAVKKEEITMRQAAEKLSVAHTTLHRKLRNVVVTQNEQVEGIDRNGNEHMAEGMVDFDGDISFASIRTLQNSQILAALQEVVGGIGSLRDELAGIRGALTDLRDISEMASEDSYESVLKSRYTRNSPLLTILSETKKTQTWRQLWIWLAEAEKELGLKQVTDTAIAEMTTNRDVIDWKTIRDEERRLKHDVMAHNHSFGKICPTAAGIIHLGATSCFVQDNADLIIQRDSIDHLLCGMATCIDRLARFAQRTVDVVTVGRTHYQTASLVTVGKRAVLWAQELVMAFEALKNFRDNMRFRGIKGATGTQDSFLTLFDGDEDKVEQLDELVMKKAGFGKRFLITGQTYSRQQDAHLLFALGAFSAAAKKICLDIRVLQAFGELLEPFEEHQIGSSAMPYKKNPMKSERVCSLFHRLVQAPNEALLTLADQGLERTLDDSANRRLNLPDSFLLTESMLRTLQNIFEGLSVQEENVARIVHDELPFLALEKAMMWLTESGVDRQQAHAKIREAALSAKEQQRTRCVSIHDTLKDPFFDPVRDRVVAIASNPIEFTGRCRSQVQDYLKNELYPAIEAYLDKNAANVALDV
ncbi:hypothetical protein QR680_012751 [Steinernema hermaphroditum]|uniref:Adenylosuccinate lyase C-terminal domain-containing protein n=1 Tax=Steinernema hermaphroditum TaxID=289476 RepID=A0AA39I5M4_9BILA|nr:hypothetical protein QR680_012751 [Steinernema hermaphroditum]